MSNLSANWDTIPLRDVVETRKGKKPLVLTETKAAGYTPYLDIEAIEKGNIRQYADEDSSRIGSSEDILMVWDGARSGWVGLGQNGAIGSTIMALMPKNIDKKFLFYFLKMNYRGINTHHRGTGIPHVDPEYLWNIEVPYPPVGEQKRIGERLDKLLPAVQKLQTRLDEIPGLLKRFRQSVLSAACSGRLTTNWRKSNKLRFGNIDGDPQNDIGWNRLSATEACKVVANGTTPKNNPFSPTGDIPFLKIYNIVHQKINFDYKSQFITSATHDKMKRSVVFPGDVIMNIVGPPLGKVAIIPNQYPEWNINQAIVVFRPKEFLLSQFLYYYLREGTEIRAIANDYKGSAGQSNISLTQARNFTLLIPSLPEQHEIIRRVEALFKFADDIEAKYNSARARIDKLSQSILSQAFSGELVENDPSELPARVSFAQVSVPVEVVKSVRGRVPKRRHIVIEKATTTRAIYDVLCKDGPLSPKLLLERSGHSYETIDAFYEELAKEIDVKKRIIEVRDTNEVILKANV